MQTQETLSEAKLHEKIDLNMYMYMYVQQQEIVLCSSIKGQVYIHVCIFNMYIKEMHVHMMIVTNDLQKYLWFSRYI